MNAQYQRNQQRKRYHAKLGEEGGVDVVSLDFFEGSADENPYLRRSLFAQWQYSQREIEHAAGDKLAQLAATEVPMTLAVIVVKKQIDRLIPRDFAWRLTIGFEDEVAVTYWPRGVTGVRARTVSDADYTILVSLLELVNWGALRSAWSAVELGTAKETNVSEQPPIVDVFEAARAEILRKRLAVSGAGLRVAGMDDPIELEPRAVIEARDRLHDERQRRVRRDASE